MIGRFQPFHNGHLQVVKEILENVDIDELIIGIGSSQYDHEKNNPFSYEERKDMISLSLDKEKVHNYSMVPIPDIHNYPIWVEHVRKHVPHYDVVYTRSQLTKRLFEEAGDKVIETDLYDRKIYSGSEIRRRIVTKEKWQYLVPDGTLLVLDRIGGVSRIIESQEDQ